MVNRACKNCCLKRFCLIWIKSPALMQRLEMLRVILKKQYKSHFRKIWKMTGKSSSFILMHVRKSPTSLGVTLFRTGFVPCVCDRQRAPYRQHKPMNRLRKILLRHRHVCSNLLIDVIVGSPRLRLPRRRYLFATKTYSCNH